MNQKLIEKLTESGALVLAIVAILFVVYAGFTIASYASDIMWVDDEDTGPYFIDAAPNGVYQQVMWGSIYNETSGFSWHFPLCEHGGWGPLHGSWNVSETVFSKLILKPVNDFGAYGFDYSAYSENSKLYVKIESNVIVDAWVIGGSSA